MRTLERNTTRIWLAKSLGEQDVVDEDGYFTGEVELSYGVPMEVELHLYPATGKVVEQTFGIGAKFDYICSTNVKLDKQDLLFLQEPIDNLDMTYDFKIGEILKSLNHYTYGLKGRI